MKKKEGKKEKGGRDYLTRSQTLTLLPDSVSYTRRSFGCVPFFVAAVVALFTPTL